MVSGIVFIWPVIAQIVLVAKWTGYGALWLDVVFCVAIITFRLAIAFKLMNRPESAHNDAEPLVGTIAGAPFAVVAAQQPGVYVAQPVAGAAYQPPAGGGTYAQPPAGGAYGAIAGADANPYAQPVKTEVP